MQVVDAEPFVSALVLVMSMDWVHVALKMCGKIYSLLWTIQIYLSNVPHIYQQKI